MIQLGHNLISLCYKGVIVEPDGYGFYDDDDMFDPANLDAQEFMDMITSIYHNHAELYRAIYNDKINPCEPIQSTLVIHTNNNNSTVKDLLDHAKLYYPGWIVANSWYEIIK